MYILTNGCLATGSRWRKQRIQPFAVATGMYWSLLVRRWKNGIAGAKAAFLFQTNQCEEPQKILAISFKTDAAQNLKERVEKRCGEDVKGRFMSMTYDAFAKSILDHFLYALPDELRPVSNYLVNDSDTIDAAFRSLGYRNPCGFTPSRLKAEYDVSGMGGEWFKCTVDDVRAAIIAVRNHTTNDENRTQVFRMRPEQEDAVNRTIAYYRSAYEEGSTRTPKFLWNAKMRFGKTFASYELAKKMEFTRVLILTFKPAVQTAWREDLISHVDFEGWQFISRDAHNLQDTLDLQYQRADKNKPIVCFGSFQDFLGVNKATGGIKANNEWVHTTNWDLVIFDEYHFGAWKDSAKKLFEQDEDSYDEDLSKYDRGNAYDETWLPITTTYYLYLSGTPFRALNSGEFIEEQIYNWTYSDEQRAKENWVGEDNPYAALPRMVMLTYKIPDSIQQIAKQGEFDEFDLNIFFSAEGKGKDAHFVYEEYVQKWLDLIRGSYLETTVDELKLGAQKPPMPFSDTRLLSKCVESYAVVPSQCGFLLCNGKSADAKAERILSRLSCECLRRYRGRHRRESAGAGTKVDGRSAGYQDDHALLRQADHRRHHQAVDRHFHAPQSVQPRNLLSGSFPRTKSVGGHKRQRQKRDYQERVLCL